MARRSRPDRFGRRALAAATSLLVGLGLVLGLAPTAVAADTASMSIQKSANVSTVTPGQTFAYTIQVQCTAGTVNGCINAQVTDPLPPYLSVNGQVSVSGGTSNPTIDAGPPVSVSFNDDLGGGQVGLAPGVVIVITIPVVVDDDIPVDASGQPLVNDATITADNATQKTDDATVTPNVPTKLNAATTKEIVPTGAPAVPGTPLTANLTGSNTSNVPVDSMVITDPVDPDATPNPFTYLGIVAPPADVTMPDGAENVQVSLYVNGAWVDGPAGPPQPAYPPGVDPADATGIRWTFTSTDGADIPPGATAGAGINMEQRPDVLDLTDPITISNNADTTVTAGGDSATSPPASDTYKIPPSAIDIVAGKSFDPDVVRAGDPSTVTLTGTNNSDGPLNSMTITEPAAGTTNHFEDGGFTYTPAEGDVEFPTGATAGTITFVCSGSPGAPQPLTDGAPLPDPPAGCDVTGFSVTFTGTIAPGAEATVPFEVTTDPDQTPEELSRDNTVQVDAANDVTTSSDQASDSILSIIDRLDVVTEKKLVPSTIPAWPGEIVTATLTGQVLPLPDSTVPATEIVVQDPANIPDPNAWYDSFDAVGVVATPVPACSTASVFYTVDGTTWQPVPGAQDVPPGIYNAEFPQEVQDDAIGIRFVYTADPAGGACSGGFPPGTSVAPNVSYSLEGDVPNEAATFTDCAASSATDGTTSATSPEACDDLDVTPIGPGEVDPIDKAWDVDLLNARSQEEAGATISWSTNGFTGIGRAQATDMADADTTALADSVYDVFDLVRIDPVTPDTDPRTGDPWLTYDQVLSLQLFVLPPGSTDPADAVWETVGPCPAACDGQFPGYTLTAAERASTIAFRLNFIESPTRGDRLTAGGPPVGSGVAASTGNDRHVHPVFQLRDDLRSDPDVPVIEDNIYNVPGDAGVINNIVSARPFLNPNDTTPIGVFYDADTIAIVDVPVTADATKSWTGGPLGIPDPGVPQDEWPTSRVTITGTNTTPAKVDELVIADPSVGPEPFDTFNLAGFVSVTPPATIGATDLVVTLSRGGTTTDYTRDQALALTEGELTDVTGFTLTYTGRINAGTANPAPTATIVFDTRLRTESRDTQQRPEPDTEIFNVTTATVSDLVDYPGVTPNSQDKNAEDSIELVGQGIDVLAGKSFSPDTLTEPATGPVTVTISGQPVAPGGGASPASRAVQLVLTDTSTTFFNAYDLTQLNPITFVTPVDQVQVDAYVGGTWSVVGGEPVLTGGGWELGAPTTDPNVTLPGTVTAEQVQGLRYTFTRADGANWENPANPTQTATFEVERRDTLNTGGPVLPDLAANPPAPGETAPGVTSNAITADVTSSDVDGNGNPLTASDDADATITYEHAENAVTVSKVGNNGAGSPVSPGADFPYLLTITNSGDVDITDPVIIDRLPTDANGAQVVLADDPRLAYAISGGTGMPTDPDDITITATPGVADATQLRWEFPAGSTLPVGATYTITFYVHTRPGLPANTVFTNEFGITADRPWDACTNGDDDTVDPETGECATDTDNTVLSAGAVTVRKAVRAEGSDVLGVDIDTSDPVDTLCRPDANGFYIRPCIPIAEPGGEVDWRLRFINSGNRPIDRILGMDRLPAPGDAVGIAPALDRGSQWQPVLTGDRPTLLTPGAGVMNVYYTTGSDWCDEPEAADGELLCAALDWQEWPAGQTLGDLGVDPATVTGLQVELLPETPLPPAQVVDLEVQMVAPAYSPADTPNTSASSDQTTYAFNSVGTAGRWITEEQTGYTLSTEPPRVGVGLGHGALQVEKLVDGPAAEFAPDSLDVTLTCTSAGQEVPLGDVANLTLTPGVPLTVYDLPVYAECELGEGDNGQTGSTSQSATVPPDGTAELPVATLTNVYEFASLAVTKTVDSDAVDADGAPVPYGPFTVDVDCTFLGDPVYAEGYGPDDPMTAQLSDGQTVTFTELPSGADCTVTETDDKGAVATTVTTQAGDGDPATTDGASAPIELATGDTNTAELVNAFTVGALHLEKVVTGDLAETYGAGPFVLSVSCVLDDESGSRSVYDGTVTLGGDLPLTADIPNLATGAECTVTETDDGGASGSTISPTEPVVIGDDPAEPVEVTATNAFDPAQILLDKVITGDAADYAADSFEVEVTCSADGEVLSGFPVTVTVVPGTPTEVPTLAGSVCSAVETDTGQATAVTYDPPNPDDPASSGEVTTGSEEPATITVTNTYRAGGLQIAKAIDGPGAALATEPFVFDVTCAFDGDPAAFTTTVTLTPTGDASSLTSDVISPLPVGAVCDVVETGSGGADVAPPPVTVTIPDVDDEGAAQVVVAGFVNPFSAATLQVAKVVQGTDPGAATGLTFTVTITCQVQAPDGALVDVYSGAVQVSGGQTVPVTDANGDPVLIQLGAHCFGTETDDGGADASSVDFDSYDNAVVVEAGDQAGALTITATNVFDAAPTTPTTPTVPTTPTTPPPGPLPNTGVAVGQMLLVALGLLAAGGGLLVVGRLRRTHRHRAH